MGGSELAGRCRLGRPSPAGSASAWYRRGIDQPVTAPSTSQLPRPRPRDWTGYGPRPPAILAMVVCAEFRLGSGGWVEVAADVFEPPWSTVFKDSCARHVQIPVDLSKKFKGGLPGFVWVEEPVPSMQSLTTAAPEQRTPDLIAARAQAPGLRSPPPPGSLACFLPASGTAPCAPLQSPGRLRTGCALDNGAQ